jgi:hypothetical protein
VVEEDFEKGETEGLLEQAEREDVESGVTNEEAEIGKKGVFGKGNR